MKCKFCKSYFRSAIKKDENQVKRLCISTGKLMHADTNVCDRFELSDLFICENNHEWVEIKVCLHRQNCGLDYQKYQRCIHCEQFRKEITKHFSCGKRRLKIPGRTFQM